MRCFLSSNKSLATIVFVAAFGCVTHGVFAINHKTMQTA